MGLVGNPFHTDGFYPPIRLRRDRRVRERSAGPLPAGEMTQHVGAHAPPAFLSSDVFKWVRNEWLRDRYPKG